ncbi:MAG: penicillin acylase family protein [Candidatus Kapaibacterium sp.]
MRLINKLPAIAISLAIILVAFVIFALNISRVSVEEELFHAEFAGIADSIKIYENPYGISHVIAANESDMFFGIGYAHAKDRLWQMEIRRRTAMGRLSEILGRQTLKADMFMRAVGIGRIVDNIYPKLSKKTKSIYESYCNGINAYIESHRNELTFEFGALEYQPEKWSPHDCLAIGRMMALELGISFWIDIAIGEIADHVGIEKALDLIADYPDEGPFVTDLTPDQNIYKPADSSISRNSEWHRAIAAISELSGEFSRIRDQLGIRGSSIGSNSWAMRKSTSDTASVILANDAHLPFSLPAPWYQLHATSPGFNVTGLTLPGVPLFLSARNDYIGWGITNLMIDDCDFFIEKIDSSGNFYFDEKDNKHKLGFKADTIKIRNELDTVYYIRYTDKSAIISDFHLFRGSSPVLELPGSGEVFFDKYSLTFRWTAQLPTDELSALYEINTARNWEQFRKGADKWGSPGVNFTYADKEGNIGIIPSGIVPKRQPLCQPSIPNPAWMKDYGWDGYHRNVDLPYIYNPRSRFVASANNKTARNLPFFVSDYWEPPSRARRIEELLYEYDKYYVRDAQLMQMDVLSPYARNILDVTNGIIGEFYLQLDFTERRAYKQLETWDFIMSESSPAAAIFSEFYRRLLINTFRDDLGDRLFREYSMISSIPHRKMHEIITDYYSEWYNIGETPDVERRDYIILRSFKDAVTELKAVFNTNLIEEWKYGLIHQLTLEHAFSGQEFIKPSVTLGPFAMGGSLTTINNAEWRAYEPYKVVLGATMRFIADMEDTLVYTVLPGGASGDALSPNYGDQVQLWLNGGYISMPTHPRPTGEFRLQSLLLPK